MKVFLVDDEKGIVTGLKTIIERFIPECEVVGAAYNGLEGYQLIRKKQPDIVITDIRMPQADGLDMIRMLKEEDCRAEFILLSGYAEFEYARKGLQLGARFYINKPVEEEELRSCVCQVMELVRADRAKLQEVDELKQEVYNRIQEDALRDILDTGSDQSDLMGELLRIAQIPMETIRFVSIMLEFDGSTDFLKELGLQPVFRQIDIALGQFRKVYRFRYSVAQIAVVIAHGSIIDYGALVRTMNRMKEAIYRELKLSITVGVGTVQEQAMGISQSFEEARNALSYKVIKGAHAVIPFSEIMNMTSRSHTVSEEAIAQLEAALDNMDEIGCVNIIREIFRGMEAEPSMSPADLQLKCLHILLSSIRKMSFQQLQQNEFLGRNILSLEGISRFRTLEYLEEWMIQVIRGILAFKLEHNIPKKKDMITEIKEYVQKHYNEPISLANLAARFYISPFYLSQVFKQKTGETYLNYLIQIRIDKAKTLLENTDLKIYEICQQVGYSDPQHFTRMFEKLTGSRPREYRKNLPSV
ncbi:AraC family transcriptional regulator [Paenibacillus terrae HPL-003]|uniref:AraC family transcriptional regulator n=1 Tax=Paenibacillus terrae (strain HPL-003) TaxID=985665 RepID=G7VQ37_PAETH|nr:response regulator [Paenibacillus terrae]AET61106.1 AraC family transcriptional regulator [Paenibacillus terrae HPL-003]